RVLVAVHVYHIHAEVVELPGDAGADVAQAGHHDVVADRPRAGAQRAGQLGADDGRGDHGDERYVIEGEDELRDLFRHAVGGLRQGGASRVHHGQVQRVRYRVPGGGGEQRETRDEQGDQDDEGGAQLVPEKPAGQPGGGPQRIAPASLKRRTGSARGHG